MLSRDQFSNYLKEDDKKTFSAKYFTEISYRKHDKAWSPYSCNGRKHRYKHVSDSVPTNFDTHEHFDYNIASFTGIVINCSVSSSCNDRSNH